MCLLLQLHCMVSCIYHFSFCINRGWVIRLLVLCFCSFHQYFETHNFSAFLFDVFRLSALTGFLFMIFQHTINCGVQVNMQ